MTTSFLSLVSINVKQLRQVSVTEKDDKIVAPGSSNLDSGCDRVHHWKRERNDFQVMPNYSNHHTRAHTHIYDQPFLLYWATVLNCTFFASWTRYYVGRPRWHGLPMLHPLNVRVAKSCTFVHKLPNKVMFPPQYAKWDKSWCQKWNAGMWVPAPAQQQVLTVTGTWYKYQQIKVDTALQPGTIPCSFQNETWPIRHSYAITGKAQLYQHSYKKHKVPYRLRKQPAV